MSADGLLPDNLSPDSFQDPRPDMRDKPATSTGMAMSIARAGCSPNSIECGGGFVSMPEAVYEELIGKKAPSDSGLRESEIEILETLARSTTGLTKAALARAIGNDAASGSVGVWIGNLVAHGYIEPGGRGRGSKGYRITQAGREFLKTIEEWC